MTILSAEQAAHFEKLLNEYEQMRDDAQAGLKETVGDLREKLSAIVAKDDLAAELGGFREAVKRRRERDKKPEKVAKAEAKSDVADAYELLLEQAPIRILPAHSARRASRVADFDPETGVVHESSGRDESIPVRTESTLAGMASPSPAAETSVEQGTTDRAANQAEKLGKHVEAEMPGPLESNSELSHGASASSDEPAEASIKGAGGMQAVETVAEAISVAPASQNPGDDHDQVNSTGRNTSDDTSASCQAKSTAWALPDRAPRQPNRAEATAMFYPDPSNPRIKNIPPMPDIPEFLRRARPEGNA